MKSKIISVDSKIKLIQKLRLIHALCESSFLISVPVSEIYKVKLLSEKFDLKFIHGKKDGLKLSKFTAINHKEPQTSIGGLNRPLIFPHSITEYCRKMWREHRIYRYTFAGLITQNRRRLINNWIAKNIKNNTKELTNKSGLIFKLWKKLITTLHIDYFFGKKRIGDLVIWPSTRGRRYPEKAWDENYYKILASSEFVLCPSGDCIWSYRFFESILCGAIPVVEKNCSAYQGFRFKYMSGNADDFVWSKEDVNYNYRLCLKRITIPIDVLNNNLNTILSKY